MFEKFKQTAALMMIWLGLSKIPIENNALAFTPEQETKLREAFGEAVNFDDLVKKMNQELADAAAAEDVKNDGVLKDLREEARKMLKAHGLSQEDADALAEKPQGASTAEEKQLLSGLIASQKEMDKKLKKLMAESEDDAPEAIIKNVKSKIEHNATHLFGSGKAYDALDRPWNKRAAGLNPSPTDFSAEDKLEIQKLKGDVDLYYRENPTEVRSLHRDLLGLPAFWNIRTNVDDKVADGNIVSGEISQARKLPWLPKHKQLIQPEESRIFPVHIDIEHQGYWLQQIEASWLNFLNREGSQPFKASFVQFLLNELDKKARQEDRMVAINGVFVKTPDNATVSGTSINRGDGILVLLWRAYHYTNKFKIANIGLPTDQNIVDYIPNLIEKNIPVESKNSEGLVLYLSPTWLRKYKTRYRQVHGIETDFGKDDVMTIENYPNLRFQTLRDLEGSDFMFITFDDNIELMENIPGEKSMYRFDSLKRNVYIYADYKWGVRFKHIGTEVGENDPASFKVQTVWCNIPPYLKDTFVPLYDDTTGKVALPYSNITVKDGWATNITELTNTFEGQVIKIKGNTGATGTVVNGAGKILLAGGTAFNLALGGTLTLRAGSGNVVTELYREAAPTPSSPITEFDATSIDAQDGNIFQFAGAGAKTLSEILNGYEGQQIEVRGKAVVALTINDVVGNINVTAEAVLDQVVDFVKFVKIDGVWVEYARNIAV